MFESWKKDPKTKEMNPQDVENMKNNRAKALLAASVGALGVTMANQADVTDLHRSDAPKQEQKMTAADLHKMQEQGPHGTTVSSNPEAGQAVVTMRPPGDEKPVDINLQQPHYDITFDKGGSVKSVHGKDNPPPIEFGNTDPDNPPPIEDGNPQ